MGNKKEDIDELLDDLCILYNTYRDYLSRDDSIEWSEEAEYKAWREYNDYKGKIKSMLNTNP